MNKHLYTIRWTQPYATAQMRPYLRDLRIAYERAVEKQLEQNEFPEAKKVLARIMSL